MTSRLLLEYDGTDFAGWAVQPGLRTVQGELEAVLEKLLQQRVALTVAGRTDAGVHARGQVASHPGDSARVDGLNALLPPDIRVLASEQADPHFDARRDALSRTYRYRLLCRATASPFERRYAMHVPRPLDFDVLDACANTLFGTHDFTAFTPTETDHVRFERDVFRAEWRRESKEVLAFWIEADTFMRHMVRVLVGTMLAVARGRMDVGAFAQLLDGAPRSAAAETAPAHGLCLESVKYPPEASR
ncbi:MAG TPA: tRNA pseudouridine(38-40) synthase TruA [Thermoleophilaceae bacterium]